MRFVNALHSNWSISIFHYRNHGADVGRIVVGVWSARMIWSHGRPSCGIWIPQLGRNLQPAYRIFLGS